MIFRHPNIPAHCNEAVLCLNVGTPLGQMENLLFLGVPILKHFRVALLYKCTGRAVALPRCRHWSQH